MPGNDRKRNCWEFKGCGREPGGDNISNCGVCPAATETRLDTIHGGTNAGRTCWSVAGTMCSEEPSGTFASKQKTCSQCDFYHLVRKEEGHDHFVPTFVLLQMLDS